MIYIYNARLRSEVVFHRDGVLAYRHALLPPLVALDKRLAGGDLLVESRDEAG